MAKSNTNKYNAVIAGYFDDFNAGRCISDDENAPTIDLAYDHGETHHGNHMNGDARLNPRYKKAHKDRVDGDETHNSGAHEFLTNDTMRDNNNLWEGKAQLSYPDGIAQPNRAKFNGSSSLASYLLITNGYNTGSHYSIHLGDTDYTNGRGTTTGASYDGSTGDYDKANFGKTGATSRDMQFAHLCGVHMGEVSPSGDSSVGSVAGLGEPFPASILEPIESPSGKPFMSITTHVNGAAAKPVRIMSYHGSLGAATDNDIFGIRMAHRGVSSETGNGGNPYVVSVPQIQYTISVGFAKANYSENVGFTGAPAASFQFTSSSRTHDGTITEGTNFKTGYQDRHPWNRFTKNINAFAGEADHPIGASTLERTIPGENSKTHQLSTIWNDWEVAFDWTAGTYTVLHDGIAIPALSGSIGTNPITGATYTPDEAFGWQIDAIITPSTPLVATEGTKVCTLIDRAYLWRDLSNTLSTTLEKMTCNYRSNGISQMTLNIMDDNDELPIYSLFKQQRNELQELMLFHNGLDRCIWRGHLESVSANQKTGEKMLKLAARDYAAALDRSIPIWEIGQSNNIDEDEPQGWRPYESTNMIQKMYFGASKLERANPTLGITAPNYRVRLDSRARLNSAHPIQMYNEEGGAPSNIWDTEILSDILGFEQPSDAYSNPQSLTNPLIVHCLSHGYVQGESITISGTTNYNGTFTVHDPSTDFFHIDKAYTRTGEIVGITSCKPITFPSSHRLGSFAIDFKTAQTARTITISDTKVDANGDRRTDTRSVVINSQTRTVPAMNGVFDLISGNRQITGSDSGGKRFMVNKGISVLSSSLPTSTIVVHDGLVAGHTVSPTISYSSITGTDNPNLRDSARAFDLNQDYIHSNGNSGSVTKVFFRQGLADSSEKLYVGAKIAIYITDGVAPAVYEITSIANLKNSPFEASVSHVSGGSLTYANIDAATSVGAGTQNAQWALIDTNLDYCSEQGFATLSSARSAAFPSNISTLLRHRAIHARWMQDFPKSLWFQKTFGVIEKDAVATTTTNSSLVPGLYANGQTIILASGQGLDASNSQIAAMATSGGVAEIINSDGTTDSFTFDSLGSLTGGKYERINNARFFVRNHPAGAKTIKIRSIRSDFRHLWVLWADMRNDGTANASDATRKSTFGLLLPTPDKYKLTIEYTDQEQVDGEPISFTDLAIGEDVNIWELDATKEPTTNQPWSALGSNSEAEAAFHNWEEKAGAFVIVDTSKFWNLNTEANGGRTGRLGGGRTDLQDYYAVNSGVPSMMDNFWIEGMASYKNIESPFKEHPDQLDFIHDASLFAADFSGVSTVNGAILQLEDVSQWRDNGVGRIKGVSGTGQNRTVYQWYYSWRGRDTSNNFLQNVKIVYLSSAYIGSATGRENLVKDLNDQAAGTGTFIPNGQPIVIDDYDELTAYNTLAPLNHMRFMMSLTGFVKDPASNTAFQHDKVRFLNMSSAMKHWLGRSNTTGISDIQNVPITKNMATNASWSYSSSAGLDSFTSIADARGNSYLGALQKIKEGAGQSEGGTQQTFTYQIGPDARIELRPGFSSFHEFDRNTLKISDFNSNMQGQITNVRVYFNNQKSFVDFPTTYTDENIRWAILDKPNIGTLEEAQEVARQHYERASTAITSIRAEVLRGNDSDIMLGGGRYGYISDPARHSFGGIHPNGRMSNSWFPGMVNALDGNKGTAVEPSYGSGLAVADNYYWYGSNSLAHAMQIVHLPKNFPKFSNSTGNQLRFAIKVNGFASGTKTDLQTASELVKFDLMILDPVFIDSASRASGSGTTDYSAETFGGPAYTTNAGQAGYGYSASQYREIELDIENGYREVVIPRTYWADGTAPTNVSDRKIIVSFNKEYLKALCRNRCGSSFNDIGTNAHSMDGFGLTVSSPNTASIFPLGAREYNIMGSLTDERAVFYGPRLQVVEDINYRVSTALKYTDSAYGYANQALILNSINWSVDNLGYEKVQMGLTTDESTFLSSFSTFTRPNVGKGDINRPAASGRDSSGGGGASGRGSTDDPVSDAGEQTQPYQPSDNLQKVPGGLKGNQKGNLSGQLSVLNIGASNMTPGMMNRIKGALDLPSGTSNNSILGAKRQMLNSIGQSYIENPDNLTPTSGTATISSDGFSFPGVMSTDDTLQPEISEYKILHTVPMGITDDLLQISVNASIKQLASTDTIQQAILDCSVKCLETNEEKTSQIVVLSDIEDNTKLNVFSQKVSGANIPGNTLEITLSRKANQGDDNAQFKTLKIHSVLTKVQKHNLIETNMGELFGF